MESKPAVPKPTELEIKQANDLLEKTYGFTLGVLEAEHFVKLVKELEWLEQAEKGSSGAMEREFTGELARVFSVMKGVAANPEELSQDANVLLTAMHLQEKKRVVGEITALIVEHRPVPIDEGVTQKAALFLKNLLGTEVDEEALAQFIQYAWRTLWAEEGLESSLNACLNDILGSSEGHSGVRAALQKAVAQLERK